MSIPIEEQVVERLIDQKLHISCAESCTGGLIAARIVNVANASRVLDVSFVTYANEAKEKYLGVSPDTIAAFDVVSEPVVAEMAKGVAKEAGSEVGIATSGVAGPSGGTDEIPVGTVCFGFYVNGKVTTYTMHFDGLSRNEVREKSTEYALATLLHLL
ncbi:MAG: CinA family protein [Lachnospiraceae bacterium]|nr:CinA family protein [Lachnospiraceae bacterium]